MMIVLAAIGIFATSGFNEDRFGTRPGDLAAPVELKNRYVDVRLASCRGQYVLLSFWNSGDAASRVLCNKYAAWQKKLAAGTVRMRHLAVNLDDDSDLFAAIVNADGLDAAAQFNLTGDAAAKVRRDYHLNEALGTLLIDPEGRIAAINPDFSKLAAL